MTKMFGIAVAVLIAASSSAQAQQKQQQPTGDEADIKVGCWEIFADCVSDAVDPNKEACKGDENPTQPLFCIEMCVADLNDCNGSPTLKMTRPVYKRPKNLTIDPRVR